VTEDGFYVFGIRKRKTYDIPAVIVSRSRPEKFFLTCQIGRFCHFYWQILTLPKLYEKPIQGRVNLVGDSRGKNGKLITQILQELTTAFTKFFILGTQYLDRVRRTTNWLPPYNEMRCVNFTRSRESVHSYGRIIGCRSSYRKLSEALMRPHALISPFLSRKGFRERIELAAGTGRY